MPNVWGTLLERGLRLFRAQQSQFGEEARPHLCIDKYNRPTPVRRRLNLTKAVRGKLIPTDLVLVMDVKERSLDLFSQYSVFHLFVQCSIYTQKCK